MSMGNDFNRERDFERARLNDERNRLYDMPSEDSSLAWLGGLFAFMLIVGGLFYAFSGSDADRVASNTLDRPATSQPITPPAAPPALTPPSAAPAPQPTPPAPAAQ
ncbi:MAG: hypothetical protein AB7K04_14615 [Pseudorhodoplanes sp.]